MDSSISKRLHEQSNERQKKHQFLRAFLNKHLWKKPHVLMYARADFDNPYQALIYSAFENIVTSPVSVDNFSRYQNFGVSNLLHIHWDEFFFKKTDPEYSESVAKMLLKFKQRGGKIIWTVHNEMPHELNADEERATFIKYRSFMCEISDLIHVHNYHAKHILLNSYTIDEQKIVVIAHPSYLDWYAERAVKSLLTAESTFILFGNLRNYKGVALIRDAFKQIPSISSKRLLIAGRGAESIEVSEDFNPKIISGYISDSDVPEIFGEANFAIFGFSSILTSGSLMLALTFGVPPIAPAHPSIKEALPKELHDLLYKPEDASDLARVINYASELTSEEYQQKSDVCLNFARQLSPLDISRQLELSIKRLV